MKPLRGARTRAGGWRGAVTRWAPFALLLIFWGVSVTNLGRYPLVEEDEPWILSPGYKLFTQGVYGSDMFRGFHNMDQHYFEFMPLMAWLEGAAARLLGVGVLQLRWLSVSLGAVALALTYALARRFTRPAVAVATLALLLWWQWTAGQQRMLGSGIPLIDITRIARYDMLVLPLGLAALWAAWQAQRTGSSRFDLLAGGLGGLAGLAHLYGLFWLGGVLVLRLAGGGFSARRAARTVAAIAAGAGLAWSGWLVYIGLHWADFLAQTAQYGERFGLLNPAFYLASLRDEPHRYSLGARSLAALGRPGFWLLIVGVPAAWAALGVAVWRTRQRGLAWLWFLSALFPALFALFIYIKTFNYLISVAPLWAMLLAWALGQLFRWQPTGRWAAAALMGAVVVQGSLSLAWMQSYASRAEPPERLYGNLRHAVPRASRVMGPGRYWLALTDRDYRSLILPFILSNHKYNADAVSFDQAMAAVAPQFVLVDLYSDEFQNNYAPPAVRRQANIVRDYLLRHRARLLETLPDNYGQPVEIYQLGLGYDQAH